MVTGVNLTQLPLLVLAILWVASPPVAPALSNLAFGSWLVFLPIVFLHSPSSGSHHVLVANQVRKQVMVWALLITHALRLVWGRGRCCSLTQTCEILLHPTPTRKQGSGPQHSQPRHVVSAMLKATTMLLSRAGNLC